ncbi:hypothetical protein ACE6H2_005122 [Prunus campanulata]
MCLITLPALHIKQKGWEENQCKRLNQGRKKFEWSFIVFLHLILLNFFTFESFMGSYVLPTPYVAHQPGKPT